MSQKLDYGTQRKGSVGAGIVRGGKAFFKTLFARKRATTVSRGPVCQLCSSPMKKTVVSSGNVLGILVALVVLVIGIAITIAIPVIGWVLGPLIVLCALFMGGKRSKVWKCGGCGAVVPRA